MLTRAGNLHNSELPALGAIVTVRDCPLPPGYRFRRFIVESFPLCDSADWRYSRGIHTCTIRALDNGVRYRVTGRYLHAPDCDGDCREWVGRCGAEDGR